MLFFIFDLFLDDAQRALTLLPVILVTLGGALLTALTVHEFGHAWVAHRLGDETARSLGRLSLNPLRHLDPAGTLMFLAAGFGWGKPVPVNPRMLEGGRRGMALVALAGPGSNFLTAIAIAVFLRISDFTLTLNPDVVISNPISVSAWLGVMFTWAFVYNLVLGVFNLIPIAPLDGSQVAIGVAPVYVAQTLLRFEPYGPSVLFLVVGADLFLRFGILWSIIVPPVRLGSRLLVGQELM